MRRNLIRAAVWAGLLLSAGTAPVFANALDSQLQPVASAIPRETVPFDGSEAPGTIIIRTCGAAALLRAPRSSGAQIRRRRRAAGLHLGRGHPYRVQAGMAGLDAARRRC